MKGTAFAKGNELLIRNNIEEAIKQYEKSLETSQLYFVYENLGYCHLLNKEYFKAAKAFRNSLKANKDAVYSKYNINKIKIFDLKPIEVRKGKNPTIVGHLKLKLLNLGFEEKASEELSDIATTSDDSFAAYRAAWELATFYANKTTVESAKKAIYWCNKAFQYSHIEDNEVNALTVLKSECLNFIEKKAEGKELIELRLKDTCSDDLTLAYSQYADDINNRIKIINQVYIDNGVSPIALDSKLGSKPYDWLCNIAVKPFSEKIDQHKVSIIIPAYNAEDTLITTLRGLQSQTWHNIEVLVVDDCSTDKTYGIAHEFAKEDKRFKVLQTHENSGPYVARNIALEASTGSLITINDADDWSHCQKIELQAQYLIEHSDVVATMSNQARMTEDFIFYRRGNAGFYIQPNMSSLMFWKESIVKAIGYWDSVRFAADSEFVQRLKLHFGPNKLVQLNTPPMSFQRQTEGSLTGSSSFGYHGFKMGARKIYEDIHKEFYKKNKKSIFMEFPLNARKFFVPAPMKPHNNPENYYDVILASDFRLPGGTTMSNIEEIKAQYLAGLKTAVIHIPRYDMNPTRQLHPGLVSLIEQGMADLLVYGQTAKCKTLAVRYPGVLQENCKYIPEIIPEQVVIVANQTPQKDYSEGGDVAYNLEICNKRAVELWGSSAPVYWAPIGPLVRKAIVEKHIDEKNYIQLLNFDWVNIINPDEWKRSKRVNFQKKKITICRHSRDSYLKWPATPSELLAIYPGENSPFNIRVLGGADIPKEILGGALPKNWKVTGFGKRHPKEFLEEKDVYVYFTNPDWIESFGRSIFEAMAVGLPVFLPYDYEPVFKEAAIYCEPQDVQEKVTALMSSPEAYYKQAEAARLYINKYFSYKCHVDRLAKFNVNGINSNRV